MAAKRPAAKTTTTTDAVLETETDPEVSAEIEEAQPAPLLETETPPEVSAAKDPCPQSDPMMGDKDPAFVEWLHRNDPEAFRSRYVGRSGGRIPELFASLPPQPTTPDQQ